jgi:hypothetical protein
MLEPKDREKLESFLKHPVFFPEEFKSWVSDWFATNIPKIPISQIYGFKVQSVKSAPDILAAQATTSTSYVDLTTIGPTLSQIPNGFYLVLFGANVWVATDNQKHMSLSVDGAAASDADAMISQGHASGRSVLVDLTNGDHQHTLTAKYRAATGTGTFADRWLQALKVTFDG